ncbi:MAG: pseudouridine synthase, partial [Alistipes sp.]|nr:pseudouridine synthase [Alistipes sp.]
MKKFTQDSSSALSRFSRDQRTRTSSAEKIERSPRPRREADNEGHSTRGGRSTDSRRSSFNPNFSADNRPNFREERNFGDEKRSYGSRSERTSRSERGERAARGGNGAGYGKKFGADRSERFERNERNDRSRSDGDFKPRGSKPSFKAEGRGGSFKGGKKPFRQSDDQKRSYPKYSAKQPGEMRLNRFLAQSGLCSRREADDFITAGLVT